MRYGTTRRYRSIWRYFVDGLRSGTGAKYHDRCFLSILCDSSSPFHRCRLHLAMSSTREIWRRVPRHSELAVLVVNAAKGLTDANAPSRPDRWRFLVFSHLVMAVNKMDLG